MPQDEFSEEDPMGLVGMVLPGEAGQLEVMTQTFVEEYVRLGWDEPRLMTLFINPMFLATHRVYRQKGEDYVRQLIRSTLARWSFVQSSSADPISISLRGNPDKPQPSKPGD